MVLHPDPEVCKLSQSESLSSGLGTHQIAPLKERKWVSGQVKQVPLRGKLSGQFQGRRVKEIW